ncbi:MAG: hypothetical protein ABSH47_00170 [Bryobacteraceae bacterium]|jgi:hypothetical protein
MELLDRYLNAVRFWLPAAQQDDIIAELGDDIRSQIEERESALGRKLDEDDLAALLKERGHPMLMAARYLPQLSLIGPVLYPAYLVVLRIVVLWVLVPVFVLIVGPITIATGNNPAVASIQTLWNLAMAAVFALGVITVVFAILERSPRNDLLKWDPRKLASLPATKPAPDPGPPIPRATAIAELVFGVIFAGVCLQYAWVRAGFNLGVVHVTLAPVWNILYWPILLSCVSGIPLGWTGLVWPSRIRLRAVIRLAIDAVTLIGIGLLAKAGPLLTLSSSQLTAPGLADATKWTNTGIHIGLIVTSIGTFVDIVQQVLRFYGAPGPAIVINR